MTKQFTTSASDYKDSVVVTDPEITVVLNHIRMHFEELVNGTKSRVVVLLRGGDLNSVDYAKSIRDLITYLGFRLRVSTTRYVLLERSFYTPLVY
jgi:hypothetical protein